MSSRLVPSPPEDSGRTSPPEPAAAPERVLVFPLRSFLAGLGVLVLLAASIEFLLLAQAGLTLIAIAFFLALALNPAVNFYERHGFRRASAVAIVFGQALLVAAVLGLVFIPPLVTQITNFVHALPGLVADLTKGHGPFGLLERKYHVVERVQDAVNRQGAGGLASATGTLVTVVNGIVTTAFGAVVIGFLTLFMLLEGREWRRRVIELIPLKQQPRAQRVGTGMYRAVGGFVTGNLVASLAAGLVATVLLLAVGFPYAVPLGLFIAIIELVPYVGPAVAVILLAAAGLTQGVLPAVIVAAVMTAYQAIEGHTLRPVLYGRAVQLSPLVVLIAIILGIELAGILGALVAIPIAGALKAIVEEALYERAADRTAHLIGQ
jgi:predicted PurR-regulated permease PerM